jgi:hypothetical protein
MSSRHREWWRAATSLGPRHEERPPPNEKRGPGAGDRAFLKNTNCNSNTQSLNSSRLAAQAEIVADLRFRRDVQTLHRLGPRAVYELLVELGRDRLIRAVIETKVKRYADRLSPELLRVIGGDRFPGGPIHLVDGGLLDDGGAP